MNLKKEISPILIVLLPFVYLAYVWNQLPKNVPLHWNTNGEVDRYGDKIELLLIPFLLPFLTYITFLFIPVIDPKNKLIKMGNKLQSLKILITTIMSILALFIINSSKNQSFANPNLIILSIGVLYIILGNYFKTIKINYFIGIRTPWTLESETVWKATHKLGGIMWLIGGITIVLASLILDKSLNMPLFLIVTALITIIPIVYSYIKFNKENKNAIAQNI